MTKFLIQSFHQEEDDVVEIKEEKVDLETYTDEDMKYEDNLAKDRIGQILQDNQKEMQSYVPKVRGRHTVPFRTLRGDVVLCS